MTWEGERETGNTSSCRRPTGEYGQSASNVGRPCVVRVGENEQEGLRQTVELIQLLLSPRGVHDLRLAVVSSLFHKCMDAATKRF